MNKKTKEIDQKKEIKKIVRNIFKRYESVIETLSK